MKVKPKRNQVVGRTVDVARTPGGIELPAIQNNATVFAAIESVGPDVTDPDYREGVIVVPHHFNHILARGGFHRLIFPDTEILGVIEEISIDQLSIEGVETSGNGQREASGEAG